jgi:hypothetical protein
LCSKVTGVVETQRISLVRMVVNVDTESAEETAHGVHIRNAGDIGEFMTSLSEQRRDHQFEDRVLRARDIDGSRKRTALVNDDAVHVRQIYAPVRGANMSLDENVSPFASGAHN